MSDFNNQEREALGPWEALENIVALYDRARPTPGDQPKQIAKATLAAREEQRGRMQSLIESQGIANAQIGQLEEEVEKLEGRLAAREDTERPERPRCGLGGDCDACGAGAGEPCRKVVRGTERPDGLIVQWVRQEDAKPGDKALDFDTNRFRRIAAIYSSGKSGGYKLSWEGDPISEASWSEEFLLIAVGQTPFAQDTEQEPDKGEPSETRQAQHDAIVDLRDKLLASEARVEREQERADNLLIKMAQLGDALRAAREEPQPKPGYWPGTADREEVGAIGDGTPHARMKWFWERMRPHEKLIGELTGWNPVSSTYRFEAAIADAFDKLAAACEDTER
jgi:hypothetical protein